MKKIFIVLVLSVFSLGAINAQSAGKKMKKNTKKVETTVVAPISAEPSIFTETTVVDYGVIEKGGDPVRSFKVINKGAKPLLLTYCSGSCGCTVPTCPREPIMPGQSADITIKYDTNRVGPINKSVSIMSNDPTNPTKTISVKGEIKEASTN